jgi:hypothetical protein
MPPKTGGIITIQIKNFYFISDFLKHNQPTTAAITAVMM